MKKYNLSKIMTTANTLRNKYDMSASEALIKAWKIARVELLENELSELNQKDISGSVNNIFAQNALRENYNAINSIIKKIDLLKHEIYPTMKLERKIKLANPTVSVTFDKTTNKYIETPIDYIIRTDEYLDTSAYELITA